jgi:serine/threonine-protein kinase
LSFTFGFFPPRSASLSITAAAALITLGPLTAHAEADASQRALAVQLFDEAEALFSKEQVAEACPKYAESYRLDPQLGVLIYLAECYEKNGQLASAWGSFREAEELALKRGDERAEHARSRATALEPRLSYLVIEVSSAARVPGLELLRDGAPIAPVLWGARAAIDVGNHRITARAAGRKPWQQDLVITGEASSATITVPVLVPEPTSPAGPGATASPGTSQRIAAIAVGGLGVVGVGVGGFFGLSAQSSLSDSNSLCNENNYCTPYGAELRDSAESKALVATIATGVGVAALVTAGVLWFTAPKSERAPDAPKRSSSTSNWKIASSSNSWGVEMSHAF